MPKSNRRELWLVWQLINDNDNDKYTDNDKHKYDENKNEYGKYLVLVSVTLWYCWHWKLKNITQGSIVYI